MAINDPTQRIDPEYKETGGEVMFIENIALNGAVRVAVDYTSIAKSIVIKAFGGAVDLFNDAAAAPSFRLADGESIGMDIARNKGDTLCYAKEVAGAVSLQLLFIK